MARSHTTPDEDDVGKQVVNADGDKIGMLTDVRNGRGYVDPDAGLTDRIRARFGWEDRDEDDYPIDSSQIEEITDDEVRLKRQTQ